MKKRICLIPLIIILIVFTMLLAGGALADKTAFAGNPDAFWELDDSGVLTISGTGPVSTDYSPSWAKSRVKKVIFEEGITEIGRGFLSGHEKVTSVQLPATTLTKIEDEAFQNCIALTSIRIPNTVTALGQSLFFGCKKMASVTLPVNITTIPNSMFYQCAIKEIALPTGITSIGAGAFYNCTNLAFIEIPDTVETIGKSAFMNCHEMETVKLPISITELPEHAFDTCTKLTSIEIPNTVKYIGEYAFRGCRSLKTVKLPDSLTIIPDYAFSDNYVLATINLPETLKEIGERAFSCCYQLRLTLPETVEEIGSGAFSSTVVYAKRDSEAAKILSSTSRGFRDPDLKFNLRYDDNDELHAVSPADNDITTLVIPEGVIAIDNGAFCVNDSITTVIIPNGVKTIDNSAFWYCRQLVSVTLPSEGLTKIGDQVFQGCEKLKTIWIPASIKRIGNSSFPESIKNVFYEGTEANRAKIKFAEENDTLLNAIWHYKENPPMNTEKIWDVSYSWDFDKLEVTGKAICTNNANHIIEETVGFKYTVDTTRGQKEATCEENGLVDITCEDFKSDLFENQSTTNAVFPKYGHDFTVNQPVYAWALNNKKAFASVKCSRCTMLQKEEVTPTVKTASGMKTYTATFQNPLFEKQEKQVGTHDVTPPQLKNVTIGTKEFTKPGILSFSIDFEEDESGLVSCLVITREAGSSKATGKGTANWEKDPQFTGTVTMEIPVNENFPVGSHCIASVQLTDLKGNTVTYEADWDASMGTYEMTKLNARDEGCSWAIVDTASINNGFKVADNVIADFEYLVSAPKLMDAVKNITDGGQGFILYNSNKHIAPAELFDAMKGKNATFTFSDNEIQWQWKGTDITKATKDIDLHLEINTESGKNYGLEDDVLVVKFADNGQLPGPARIRIKSDYYFTIHGLNHAAYLFYRDGDDIFYENSAVTAVLDRGDHWCEFTVRHNSTFIIAPKPIEGAVESGSQKIQLTSVKFNKEKATIRQDVTITAKTSTNATRLAMYTGGKEIQSWTTGYTDKGSVRTWKVTFAFTGTGKKSMSFKAISPAGKTSSAKTAVITITKAPTLNSLTLSRTTSTVNQKVTITAKTSTNAIKLVMYTGGKAVKSWTEGYTDKGSVRTWKITYAFTGAGDKALSFKAIDANGAATEAKTAEIKVTKAPLLNSVKFSKAQATVKQTVTIVAKTSTTASKLIMYAGSKAVKSWTLGFTDSGTTRTWKVTYEFTGTGNKTLTFKASDANGVVTAAKTAKITITKAPTLNSVKFDEEKAKVKTETTITAKTSTNTTKLVMYSGSKTIKSWTAGYTDNGSTRTWKVTYTFTGTGNKAMSFKAFDANGAATGAKDASIEVIK